MKTNDQSQILVSIVTLAYNHAEYIRQCLDGFIMQQTTFAFEVLIHDDASTDGTTDIIREYEVKYPHIIKPIYQRENQHQKGIAIGSTYLYPRVLGKYIAECEGDDYWTDPLKLQKQVDFMEHHPEYGLCYSKVVMHYQTMSTQHKIDEWGGNAETFIELLSSNSIPTLTTLYRAEFPKQYALEIHPEQRAWKMGDYPFWLWIARHHKIKFFDTYFGCYRILEESASHSLDSCKTLEFFLSATNIKLFFALQYHWARVPYLLFEKIYRHLKILQCKISKKTNKL